MSEGQHFFPQRKTYRFLPMSGPLSSLVADIFMDDMENQILTSGNVIGNILYYDIFCVWNGIDDLLQCFLQRFNRSHPSTTFTLKVGHNTLNFSDLTMLFLLGSKACSLTSHLSGEILFPVSQYWTVHSFLNLTIWSRKYEEIWRNNEDNMSKTG